MSCPEAGRWLEATRDESSGMVAQDVSELQEVPRGARQVGSMWVLSDRLRPDGSIARYEAQLVAQCCGGVFT
jgi:hypothetical protein